MSPTSKTDQTDRHLESVSLLDALRPHPGWRTDRAVLSSYSGETAVIVAALLALVDQADEAGAGTRLALARSLSQLRGKVHFVLQAGRLGLPKNPAPILALLDRFLVQMPWDEGDRAQWLGRSWHPKFAVVRQLGPKAGELRWVFVLGSRNLTRDTSWDLCLTLEGTEKPSPGAQMIPGIAQLARALSTQAEELGGWSDLVAELSRMSWSVPDGLQIDDVRLMLPGEADRRLPEKVPGVRRLLAVAPFLDGNVIAQLSRWCDDRSLLSTRPFLEKLAQQASSPLRGWRQLLELPTPEYVDHDTDRVDDAASESAEDVRRGLHAKFLFAESDDGSTLWLGSPNLTQRAWTRNAEVYAQIRIVDPSREAAASLVAGLRCFEGMATPVSVDDLASSVLTSSEEEQLDEARRQVAARLAQAKQVAEAGHCLVRCEPSPHPDDSRFELYVSRIGEPFLLWSRGEPSLELQAARSDITVSALLRIKIQFGDLEAQWLHTIPVYPEPSDERDNQALREYLGARQTLAWLCETLGDIPAGDGGGHWDSAPGLGQGSSSRVQLTAAEIPTVESALRAWMRAPESMDEADRILKVYGGSAMAPTDEAERKALDDLRRFAKTWSVIRKSLPRSSERGR